MYHYTCLAAADVLWYKGPFSGLIIYSAQHKKYAIKGIVEHFEKYAYIFTF